jgi:Rab GDP dissociation inhibitor
MIIIVSKLWCGQVPATAEEAVSTTLIGGFGGLFEKRRFKNFLSYLAKYDENDPSTFGGE